MYARRFLSGLAASAVTASVLALTATPAMAAVDPDDTPGTPVAADLIGVGSDTSQNAMFLAANAYNAQSPAPSAKLFSYAATGGGTIPTPGGEIARPNGSTAGKALLYGSANEPKVDYARSSSALSTAEAGAGLQAFPFALDTLVMVTSGSTATHAPASLTPAQIVSIYKGDVTNWSQLGGSNGVIKPLIPQAGSGTRSFFVAQLKAANGNVDVVLGSAVKEAQEHDPGPVQGDADAIAPFSKGRAGLAGSALKVEGGFSADRALYNVVRGADLSNAAVQSVFGESGFLCSDKATASIEAAGFRQLSRTTGGGVCGVATQAATSNFTTSVVTTTTTVTVTSPVANQARVVARVSAGSAPSGRVTFYEGSTVVASNVPLVSGAATATLTTTPGAHTYRAVFTPSANSSFTTSESTGSGTVSATTAPAAKASSTLDASFPAKAFAGKKVKGSVTVKVSSGTAAGTVTVKLGSKTVGTGSISGGVAKITLKGLKVGKNKLTATYAGSATVNGSSDTFTVKVVKKPKKK